MFIKKDNKKSEKKKKKKKKTHIFKTHKSTQHKKFTEKRAGLNQVKKDKFKMQDGKKQHQPWVVAFIIKQKVKSTGN